MDHGKAAFKRGVEGLFGRFLFCGGAVLDDGFGVLDVDVTEVVVPIFVRDSGSLGEFAGSKGSIDFGGGGIELMEDPEFSKGFVTGLRGMFLGLEGGVKFSEHVFCGLIDFVTELAIAMHLFYVEVDVAAWKALDWKQYE